MRFLLDTLAYTALLAVVAALMFWVFVGSDVVMRIWDKLRAGDLAGSYVGLPLTVLFALAILIALLRRFARAKSQS